MAKRLTRQLWFQVVIAMVLGLVTGLLLSPTGAGLMSERGVARAAPWIALPGNVFLALIKTVVIPLVLSSIVLGLTSSPDPKFLRKAAARIFPYFVGTTVVAIAIGMLVASVIKPGRYIKPDLVRQITEGGKAAEQHVGTDDTQMADRIVALIPSNYVRSALEQDMLATVVLGLMIGLAMVTVTAPVRQFCTMLFQSIQEVSLVIIGWAMRIAPVAVFALICTITMRIGFAAIAGMAAYIGTVLLGLFCQLLFYLTVVAVLGRARPLEFLGEIREVQLLAFSTSSSAAVMPLSMQTAEAKLGISPPIVRFIIPLGATINMDGTALYQVAATIFLTQVFGVHLGMLSLVALAATAVGASIGTPSTPGVGIVVLATLLQGVGVPASGIALIIGVDRILDMSRTTLNVTGDLTACLVMNRWLGAASEPKPVVEFRPSPVAQVG